MNGDHTNKQAIVDKFQTGEYDYFITSFKAGGEGFELSAANTVFIVGRPWKSGDAEQGEDRVYVLDGDPTFSFWLQLSSDDVPNVYPIVDQLLREKAANSAMLMRGEEINADQIDLRDKVEDVLHLVFTALKERQS